MIGLNLIKNPTLDNVAFNNIGSATKQVTQWLAAIIIGSATLLTGCNGNNENTPCPAIPYGGSGQALIEMQSECKDLTKPEKQTLEKYVNPSELHAGDNFTNDLNRDVIYEFAKQVKRISPETPARFSPEDIGRLLQILPEQEFKKLEKLTQLPLTSMDQSQREQNQTHVRNEITDVIKTVIAPFPKEMSGKDIVAALEILHQSPQNFEYLDKTTPENEIKRGNNILTQAYLTNNFIPKIMEKTPPGWAFADVSKVIEHVQLADYSSTEFKGTKYWEDASESALNIIKTLSESGLSRTDALKTLNLDAIGGEDVGRENLSKSANRVASLINELKAAGIEPTFPRVVKKMKESQPPFDRFNTGLTPSPDPERKNDYTPIPEKIQNLYDAAETALHEGNTTTFKESFITALNAAPNTADAVESILRNLEPLNDKPEEMKKKVYFTIDYIKNNYPPQALDTLMFTLFTGKNSSIEEIANQETLNKLINGGADPAAVNRNGFNIPAMVSYFQAGQDVEIRKLFENHGVKINILPESQAPKFQP
jgi:hypothetical protein